MEEIRTVPFKGVVSVKIDVANKPIDGKSVYVTPKGLLSSNPEGNKLLRGSKVWWVDGDVAVVELGIG